MKLLLNFLSTIGYLIVAVIYLVIGICQVTLILGWLFILVALIYLTFVLF